MKLTCTSNLQSHIKEVVELFNKLETVGDSIKDKDIYRVIILLSSLPTSFDVLVTALQAHVDISRWEDVVEKLFSENAKRNEKTECENLLVAKSSRYIRTEATSNNLLLLWKVWSSSA